MQSRAAQLNSGAQIITNFSQSTVVKAVDYGLSTGFKAKNDFLKTGAGSKIASNKYFIHAGNLGAGIFNFASNTFYGLENAFQSIGDATKDSTTEVIAHKYGQDASQLFRNTASAAWSTYQIRGNISKESLKRLGHYMKQDLNENFYNNYSTMVPTLAGEGVPILINKDDVRNYYRPGTGQSLAFPPAQPLPQQPIQT